ncbi:MAG: threonine aldolase [Flavobacteriales bacterium]|nr:threonine aldolase [Flavobacteriales bacterium]
MIDLRSDTVTRPTAAMRAAMAAAEVGDDVFGEDPTVNLLEERVAALFGKEAGLFCPSGTMTNQIAVNIHTRPGDEVLCEEGAHIYRYEGGGVMANSGCSVKFLTHDRGRFTAAAIRGAFSDPMNPHLARTRLVNIENTSNRGGGAFWDLEEVWRIRAVCDELGLTLHMDGARIFNAIVATGTTAEAWGAPFETISICLSKGLGAPVGSVLVGSKERIHHARRIRKRFGGGMRQVGILAAAGLHAVDHHVERLAVDHKHARELGAVLSRLPYVAQVVPVDTNIVVSTLHDPTELDPLLTHLASNDIRAMAFGPGMMRMVTHLDVDAAAIERTCDALASFHG